MYEDSCDSPLPHDSFKQNIQCASTNSGEALRRVTIFSELERTATNYNVIGDLCHEFGFVAVRRKDRDNVT